MKKLKLLLMNSPHQNLDNFDRVYNKKRGNVLFPPLTLTTIAAGVLQKVKNVEIEILDMEFEIMKFFNENEKSPLFPKEFLKNKISTKLNTFKPDVVGLSLLFSQAHPNSFIIAKLIKENNPNTKVVCGGNHATFAHKRMLEQCPSMDFIFLHEADNTFPAFLEYLNGNIAFNDLKGIAWLEKSTNKVKLAPSAEKINNLDTLPIPKANLIPIRDYQKYGRAGSTHRSGDGDSPTYTIQTSRGCTAECTFCSVRSFNGKGVRGYSAKRVLEEIDYLYNDLGIKQFEIVDDDFSFDKARTLEICNGLIKRNYDLVWSIQHGIRLGTLVDEVMHAMILAKCRAVAIGVESGNDTTLAIIKKPMSVKMLYRKSEIFKKYPELYVRGNYIIGFPFENDEQTLNTFTVADEIGFDWNSFNVFRPIVGTPEFQKLSQKKQEHIIDNQKDLQSYHAIKKTRNEIAKEMQLSLLNAEAATKYGNAIEEQMKAQMMHEGASEKEESLSTEQEEIAELAYIKNLEINFLNNKNLNGLSIDKYIDTKKGKYYAKLDKPINVDRAIRDFEEITKFHDENHAIAYYCLAKAYHYKGNKKLTKMNLDKVSSILSNSLNKRWIYYFNKLVSKKEFNDFKNLEIGQNQKFPLAHSEMNY